MQTKSELRKVLRAKRAEVSLLTRQTAAQSAAQLIVQHPLFQTHKQIACYLPGKNEFNMLPIIEILWQQEKNCYLPVLAPEPQNGLVFLHYQKEDPLHYNEYDILEPDPAHAEPIAKHDLDIVFVPLIGFDLQGHRLGTGGGYYDRTFSFLLERTRDKKPYLIGVGYSFQQVENLVSDSWDVPLDGLLTEKDCIFPLITK